MLYLNAPIQDISPKFSMPINNIIMPHHIYPGPYIQWKYYSSILHNRDALSQNISHEFSKILNESPKPLHIFPLNNTNQLNYSKLLPYLHVLFPKYSP